MYSMLTLNVEEGSLEGARKIIEHPSNNVDIEHKNENGFTLLAMAIKN